MGAGLLGAFWAVSAQEGGRLWAPPPVFPTGTATPVSKGADKKAPAKPPQPADPSRNTKADPTLIVPAEAYDLPRPVQSGSKPTVPDLLQVQGTAPLPVIPPPSPERKKAKQPIAPPPLPAIDTDPLPVPMPPVDPTKPLIVEPPTKEPRPKKSAVPEMQYPPPAVVFPPPALSPETKKEAAVQAPSLVLPPPSVIPETTRTPLAPTSLAQADKPKAFVRIESAARSATPASQEPGAISPDPG